MTGKAVRLAVIGLGMAARPHLDGLAELRGTVDLAGLYNRSHARAVETAARYGVAAFDSVEAITADPTIDGVVLLTPPNQRRDLVQRLASAGKHILAEKPIERTMAAAEDIVATCERHGVSLGIVFQYRFRDGAQRLARLVREGALGQIGLVQAAIPWWRDQPYYEVQGRGTYERDGGGVLISQAIHSLDLMLSLTGPAAEVQALCATTSLHRMESEDFAAAGVRFASGAVGSIAATTAAYPGSKESIALHGTLASATLTGGDLDIVWRDGRRERHDEAGGTGSGADPMAFPCDWHRDLIADFAAAIKDRRPPAIPGREALRVHALIDAMTISSRTGKATPVAAVGGAT